MTRLSAIIRLLLLFSCAVLILLFFYFGIFMPKDEKIKSIITENNILDKKASSFRQQKKDLSQALVITPKLPTLPKEIFSTAPDQDDSAELLSLWTQQGKLLKLDFLLFKPLDEKYLGPLVEMPIEIKLRGTFDQTYKFLEYMSQLERKILISDIEMSRPERSDGNYVVSTHAVATAFRKQGK